MGSTEESVMAEVQAVPEWLREVMEVVLEHVDAKWPLSWQLSEQDEKIDDKPVYDVHIWPALMRGLDGKAVYENRVSLCVTEVAKMFHDVVGYCGSQAVVVKIAAEEQTGGFTLVLIFHYEPPGNAVPIYKITGVDSFEELDVEPIMADSPLN
jgi:hypothetical protein